MSNRSTDWTVNCTALDGEDWGGYPLSLQVFRSETQRIFPRCSFALRTADKTTLWIYHAYKPLCMGWIGVQGINDVKYIVGSRLIENNKYASYSDGHHTVTSKKMDVGLRSVRTYLRDPNVAEIAAIQSDSCRDKWCDTDATLARRMREARNHVVRDTMVDNLLRELLVIESSGHKYINLEFGQRVTDFLDLHREKMEALKGRTTRMMMVSVEKDFHGNDLYLTALTDDISVFSPKWREHNQYTAETISEELMGKLSVLSMGQIDQYFDNVGYRATETCFYVVQEDVR